MKRVTVFVPETLRDAANHVCVFLGKTDLFSCYIEPSFKDSSQNSYCVSSGLWSESQIIGVQSPDILTKCVEEDIVPEGVSLSLAQEAQSAFVLYDWSEVNLDGGDFEVPEGIENKITAVVYEDAKEVLSRFELSRIEIERPL